MARAIRIFMVATFAMAAFVGAPQAAHAADPSPDRAAKLADAMAIYKGRVSLSKHRAAAKAFADLAASFPKDKELQVWCARTSYHAAHRVKQSKSARTIALRGVKCAKRILDVAPKDYDGRYWWIRSRFKAKSAEGVMDALKLAPEMNRYVTKMLRDEPKRFEAYMILGLMYRELPGPPLSFGDADRALVLLRGAAKNAPYEAEVLLELALAYEKVGDEAKARATYKKCITKSRGLPELSWETKDAQAYAKKMLAEL